MVQVVQSSEPAGDGLDNRGGPSALEQFAQAQEIDPSKATNDAAATEAQQAAAAEAMKQMNAAAGQMLFGAFKALRTRVAKKLPEIRDEWTDEALRAPADAAVPVVQKYMGRLMRFAAGFEEEGALAFALLPLAMGYMAAVEKHSRTVSDAEPKP